jgi:glucokinase
MRAVGLDVGGTHLKLVVLDDEVLTHRDSVPVPPSDLQDFVVETARSAMSEHAADSMGLGLAGLVTHPGGTLVWGPHLRGRAIPFRSTLTDALGVPVVVDNDANLAAHAEWALGAGERADPMIMITLGTGIGAGFMIGGEIYRGVSFAGEAGHLEVVADGEVCECGRSGCWETLVSGGALDRVAARIAAADPGGLVAQLAKGTAPTGVHLARAAETGHAAAVGAIEEAGHWLGRGLANLVLLFDPALIVVGGAAADAGPLLLDPARTALAQSVSGSVFRKMPAVVPGRFGGWAGAVGAALAAGQVHNGRHDR